MESSSSPLSSSAADGQQLRRRRRPSNSNNNNAGDDDNHDDANGHANDGEKERPTNNHNNTSSITSNSRSCSSENTVNICNDTMISSTTCTPWRLSWAGIVLIAWHLLACLLYIYGLVLRQDLHSSVECSMTYSQRQLIPIPLQFSSHTNNYGLYKFVDQRDPRPHHRGMLQEWLAVVKQTQTEYKQATQLYLAQQQQQQQQQQQKPRENQYCTMEGSSTEMSNNTTNKKQFSDTVVVLYIPGHWGSYMQSRSIGAHGIQLTGARSTHQTQTVIHALAHDLWAGQSAPNLNNFVFDVYAIDFQEQGGALHAQLLLQQTAFCAHAVMQLVTTCQLSQIIILGHSIGGYVSRLIPMLYPETRPYIQNIITLGSPHAHAVFGWESTVHQLHQTYLKSTSTAQDTNNNSNNDHDENDPILVAISGGLRDEMIPPEACNADHIPHSISVLAPTIMEQGPDGISPQLGMDHRAIVWCHNLLSVVRTVVFHLAPHNHDGDRGSSSSSSPQQRLQRVRDLFGLTDGNDNTTYTKALEAHQARFVQLYGFVSALAMECAMLYHVELLVGLYVLLGCLKGAGIIGRLFPFVGNQHGGVYGGPLWMELIPLAITTCVAAASTNYDIDMVTLVMLTLVANAVFWAVQFALGVALPYVFCKKVRGGDPPIDSRRLGKQLRLLTVGVSFLSLGLQCVGKLFCWQARLCLVAWIAVYFSTICSTIAICSMSTHNGTLLLLFRNGHYNARLLGWASTLLVICPFLVTGKIVALLAGENDDNQKDTTSVTNESPSVVINGLSPDFLPLTGLVQLTIWFVLPAGIQMAWLYSRMRVGTLGNADGTPNSAKLQPTLPIVRCLLQLLAILYVGPSLFQMGRGYRAGDLMATISWLECFFLPFST